MAIFVGAPLTTALLWVKFVGGPAAASWAARQYAEQYHVRLEVGDWRLDLLDTVIEARNVSLEPLRRRSERGDRERYGAFRHDHLMDIGKVEIDFSVHYGVFEWIALKPFYHLIFNREALVGRAPLNHVRLSAVRANVERRLPNRGNWDLVLTAARYRAGLPDPPAPTTGPGQRPRQAGFGGPAGRESEKSFELALAPLLVVAAEDVDLVWIHEFHIGSGDGGTRRGEQQVDLRINALELTRPTAGSASGPTFAQRAPTNFWLDGRLGEGKLQADGSVTFARQRTVQAKIHLDGVGLASLWRDQFGIQPTRGRFTGVADMEFDLGGEEFEGRLTGYTEGLAYVPSPQRPRDTDERARLVVELAGAPPRVEIEIAFKAPREDMLGSYQRGFGNASLQGMPIAQAEFQAGPSADPTELGHGQRILNELAAEGARRVATEVGASLGSGVGEAVGGATEALMLSAGTPEGEQPAGAGSMEAQPAAAGAEPAEPAATKGNALTRGAKKVGRGLKRVFTGGRKKKQQEAAEAREAPAAEGGTGQPAESPAPEPAPEEPPERE